jgi:hypothetical protein
MRVIIKPLGAILLLMALVSLSFLTLKATRRNALANAGVSPMPAAPARPTVPNPGSREKGATRAVEGPAAPANAIGIPLIEAGTTTWKLQKKISDGALNIVPVSDSPVGFKQAIHIQYTGGPSDHAPRVQAKRKVPFPLTANKPILLRFWGRSPEKCRVRAVFEIAQKPYDKDLDQTFALTPEWKHYELSFTTSKDYPSNGSQIALQVGCDAGTYEFSQFEMMEVPPTP